MISVTPRRPLLRYFGGKWSLANWIIEHFPEHRIYVEPFGGAASVLLRKEPSYSEIYNDLDDGLINLFRVLQNESKFEDLFRRLRYTLYSRQEYESAFEPGTDDVDEARRFIIRSWMGFGSAAVFERTGFRSNVRSDSTNPQKQWVNYVDSLPSIFQRLRAVQVDSRDYKDVLAAYDATYTLFYVDPPYVLSTRNRRVYNHEMDDQDHVELAESLNGLSGMVVLSGYPSDLYSQLYKGWTFISREHYADAGRSQRHERTEGLWINEACQSALQPADKQEQKRLF